MTTEYLAKRIFHKMRVISDFDHLTYRKLHSMYIYSIVIIILADLAYILSYCSLIDNNSINLDFPKNWWLINLYIVFVIFMSLRNQRHLKFETPHLMRYVEELSEYSTEEKRKIIKQGNRRERYMEIVVEQMLIDQFLIPSIFIGYSVYHIYKMLIFSSEKTNLIVLFYLLVVIASSIGFLLGIRQNSKSFKKLQKTIAYRTRNIIVDYLIFSKLNPGTDKIRKPK